MRFVPPGEPYEYRPPSDEPIIADRPKGPNRLFIILGAVAALAVAIILAVVFLVGSSDEDGQGEQGSVDADDKSFEELMESGKDSMQAEDWAEAARFFAAALMKDGHTDAYMAVTSCPQSTIIDLNFRPGVRFLGIDPVHMKKVLSLEPGLFARWKHARRGPTLRCAVPRLLP